MMNKKTKIIRGKKSYLYDAECVLIVDYNGKSIKYNFNTKTKILQIVDEYSRQDYMYGRQYRVYYIVDKQILREEQIKKLLDEDKM